RGRCRKCGAKFSVRYFIVELFTASGFVALLYLEIILNIHHSQFMKDHNWLIDAGAFPWQCWVWFLFHATLFSFLLTASLCDLEHMEMPISITLTGTVVGLIGATLLAWPWPEQPLPPFLAAGGQ